VFHWGGFDTVGKMALSEWIGGFLRLVLDRYRGMAMVYLSRSAR